MIGITGHQTLEDGTAWEWVEAELISVLEEHPDEYGVSSLAIGADQLFAHVLIKRKMQLIVVIPCHKYADTFDSTTIKAYHALLSKATEKIELNYIDPSQKAFYAAGKKVADLSDTLIAVWDGQPAKGLGGTGDIVLYAEAQHKDIIHINPVSRKVLYVFCKK